MARGRVRKGRRQAVSLVVCAYVVMTLVLLGLAAVIAYDCLRWHEGPTRTLRVRSTFADELHYAFAADFSTGLGADRPAPDVQLLSGAPDDVIVREGISTLRVGLFVPPGAPAGTYLGRIVLSPKDGGQHRELSIPFSFRVRTAAEVWWPIATPVLIAVAIGFGVPWVWCLVLYRRARCWLHFTSVTAGRTKGNQEIRKRHPLLCLVLQCSKHHLRFSDEDGWLVDCTIAHIFAQRPPARPVAPAGAAPSSAPGTPPSAASLSGAESGAEGLEAMLAPAAQSAPPQEAPQAAPTDGGAPAGEVSPATVEHETGRCEFLVVFPNRFAAYGFAIRNVGDRTFTVAREGKRVTDTLSPGDSRVYDVDDKPTIDYKNAGYTITIIA